MHVTVDQALREAEQVPTSQFLVRCPRDCMTSYMLRKKTEVPEPSSSVNAFLPTFKLTQRKDKLFLPLNT